MNCDNYYHNYNFTLLVFMKIALLGFKLFILLTLYSNSICCDYGGTCPWIKVCCCLVQASSGRIYVSGSWPL